MPGDRSDAEKLGVLLGYWIEHNREHIAENRSWTEKAAQAGLREAAARLKKAVELSEEANHHLEHAREEVEEALAKTASPHPEKPHGGHRHTGGYGADHVRAARSNGGHLHAHRHIEFHQIGTIRTPYRDRVPPDAAERDGEGEFSLVVNEEFQEGLRRLDGFTHAYVLFNMDRPRGPARMTVTPPRGGGVEVGVFSSRSPDRPNPIGLSIVRVLGVSGNVVRVSAIDALDGTPLLDIKPYFGSVDSRPDAGDGWLGEVRGGG